MIRQARNASEQSLQILRELVSTLIDRVHGDEITNLIIKQNLLTFVRERERNAVVTLSICDGKNLLSYDGKHRKLDTIKFVDAPPKPCLAETFENSCHVGVSLLIRAIGDDDEHN